MKYFAIFEKMLREYFSCNERLQIFLTFSFNILCYVGSDPFIKNENSVLPILTEKNFEQKIYFCLLKIKSIFFKEGKSFSELHVKNSRFFLSYFLKKDDWLKAYAGLRLPTLPYNST